MADDSSERPVDPRVSPYLRRPLRTLKEAEQDNDASHRHLISVPSPPDPPVPRSPTSPNRRDAVGPRKQR
jgi:hypothetical protein